MTLAAWHTKHCIEAGCDEAGRGCLAGPVFAAAVIFQADYTNSELADSKQLSEKKRIALRTQIEQDALAFAIGIVHAQKIDEINILRASFLAMHKALEQLSVTPEHILIDGNRFTPFNAIPHTCVVKGDSKYMSIAAASILAKTYRDEYMQKIHKEYPVYNWKQNKGYPTLEHRNAVFTHGYSPYHRTSFSVSNQLSLSFPQ